MESHFEKRSDRKRKAVLDAATNAFLSKGYDGASIEDIASLAKVSKPTVYRFFADKETLFAEIVFATTGQVNTEMHEAVKKLAGSNTVEKDLTHLARKFLQVLMQPEMLRLRRLVIANAERFPDVCRAWYDQGFERMLSALAGCFEALAKRKLLRSGDGALAAQHFVGLLLWIPVNKAMFSGDVNASTDKDLERYARSAVRAFLSGYASK